VLPLIESTPQKIIAICQPNFFPWLGYFEMADRAHIYVMLDDAQFIKRDWVNRNRILNNTEKSWQWITLPGKKAPQITAINQIQISQNVDWRSRMLGQIRHIYAKAPFFTTYFGQLQDFLNQNFEKLVDVNIGSIRLIMGWLGMADNLRFSSEFELNGIKQEKLIELCLLLGADMYLANNGSENYIVPEKFTRQGIKFVFQDYQHPEYMQGPFSKQNYLSTLDVLFWHGPAAYEIILSGRRSDWIQGAI
jgi:hypothetical protein